MTKIHIVPEAEAELNAAVEWYESQRPGLAGEFLDAFEQATQRLCSYPTAWRRIASRVRSCPLHRFPYSVLYTVQSDQSVLIVAVMHLHRKPGYWKDRK